MRLRILLPKVNPEAIAVPSNCPYAGCSGRKFHVRQQVSKPLRDTVYQEAQVPRYQCLRCKRTFRVYPEGTTRAQTSQRVKGLAVMLYLLGLSYGAVSLALEGLLISLCKSRVYDAVQEAAEPRPWPQAGAGVCRGAHPGVRRRSDRRQLQRGVGTVGHHGRSDQWPGPHH